MFSKDCSAGGVKVRLDWLDVIQGRGESSGIWGKACRGGDRVMNGFKKYFGQRTDLGD